MISLERNRFQNLIGRAGDFGPHDDLPVLLAHMDPQLCLARHAQPQPLYLILESDSVLAILDGFGHIELKASSVRRFSLEPGAHIYIPARTPHRIVPRTEILQLRYKALHATCEGVAWFCARCDREVWRHEFDPSVSRSQREWFGATTQFNEDKELRTCTCGEVHPAVDLDGIRWLEVADAIDQWIEKPDFMASPSVETD